MKFSSENDIVKSIALRSQNKMKCNKKGNKKRVLT